jgi:hypothetical protein
VLSGEHRVRTVCTRLGQLRRGPDTGGGSEWKDGDTLACSAIHRAKHQGCGTRDTLCMIWELWAECRVH